MTNPAVLGAFPMRLARPPRYSSVTDFCVSRMLVANANGPRGLTGTISARGEDDLTYYSRGIFRSSGVIQVSDWTDFIIDLSTDCPIVRSNAVSTR